MSTNDPAAANWPGRVRPANTQPTPTSTLVTQVGGPVARNEAIVLQGYAGPSLMAQRALEFLEIAQRNGDPYGDAAANLQAVQNLQAPAEANIRRMYLTAGLDQYVDFHRSCVLAWRYEASPARQDAITVWLRAVDNGGTRIPYRVIQETRIGPSLSAYLGGSLLDDYLGQGTTQGSAWGATSGVRGGGRPRTTPGCGD